MPEATLPRLLDQAARARRDAGAARAGQRLAARHGRTHAAPDRRAPGGGADRPAGLRPLLRSCAHPRSCWCETVRPPCPVAPACAWRAISTCGRQATSASTTPCDSSSARHRAWRATRRPSCSGCRGCRDDPAQGHRRVHAGVLRDDADGEPGRPARRRRRRRAGGESGRARPRHDARRQRRGARLHHHAAAARAVPAAQSCSPGQRPPGAVRDAAERPELPGAARRAGFGEHPPAGRLWPTIPPWRPHARSAAARPACSAAWRRTTAAAPRP